MARRARFTSRVNAVDATRAPVFTCRVNAVKVRHIEWQNPKAVTELSARRQRIFAYMATALEPGRRVDVEIHRNHCIIVREHDDSHECTCVPLVMYTGALA